MNAIVRILLAIVLAAWISSPSVGSEGGENAGGTGIWILPRATFFSGGTGLGSGVAPREVRLFANANQDIRLAVSDEVGAAVATLVEDASGASSSLPVTGFLVVIPSSLQQSLLSSNSVRSTIVIADASQLGYFIEVVVFPTTGKVELRVY